MSTCVDASGFLAIVNPSEQRHCSAVWAPSAGWFSDGAES
jgi:hypothetical protein